MINIDCNSNFKKSDKWNKLYTNKTNFGYCPLNRGCPLNMVSRLIQVSLYNDPSERRLFLASIIYHLFNNRWQRPCNLSHSQHPQCYRRWWGVIWMPCCWRPDSYNSLVTWERSAFLVIFVREWRANHFLNEAWRRRNLLLQSCEQIRSQHWMLKKVLFRPRSYVSGNFWIRNFFFANSASVHTYPVYPAYESVCQSGDFWIRYESGIAWTLIPDMFLSSDVTTSSPVLYQEYSRRCQAQWVIASTLLGLQFQVITCVLLNLAMITWHFNYAKRRLHILKIFSRSDGRIWTP